MTDFTESYYSLLGDLELVVTATCYLKLIHFNEENCSIFTVAVCTTMDLPKWQTLNYETVYDAYVPSILLNIPPSFQLLLPHVVNTGKCLQPFLKPHYNVGKNYNRQCFLLSLSSIQSGVRVHSDNRKTLHANGVKLISFPGTFIVT